MEFTMESRYGKKTLADMSRALRKTTRKKSNRRSMIWAWVVLALNLLFLLTPGEEGFVWNWNRILNGAAALLMIFVILRQDAINGFFARKRMLKGNGYSRVTFGEEGYTSTTENAMTQWSYSGQTLCPGLGERFPGRGNDGAAAAISHGKNRLAHHTGIKKDGPAVLFVLVYFD